jgi:hypothetical protein
MCWKICLPLAPTKPGTVPVKPPRKVCFCIPYIPIDIKKPPVGDPPPWITKGFIEEKLARDLPVLATIDALASQLSNATVRRTMQRAIQGAVDLKSLPENMKIEFE